MRTVLYYLFHNSTVSILKQQTPQQGCLGWEDKVKTRCLISGEVPGSLIKRFQQANNDFKKVWVYVVDITELISVKQDLMHLTRQQSSPYRLQHCKSGIPPRFYCLLKCNLKFKKECTLHKGDKIVF